MSDGRVLVIEDDTERARTWQELLEFADFEPLIVSSPDAAPWEDPAQTEWVAALVHRCDRSLCAVLDSLRRHDAHLPVVTLGTDQGAGGPADDRVCGQVPLPVRYPCLVDALHRARRWRRERESAPRGFPVGRSAAIAALEKLIRQVAGFDSTVLIYGESGTGKELVARRIHELSDRADAPFVPLNCGAVPRELLESELFGHEKGAFTGAITRRTGRFELADGGTLFLDEIGDMSMDMQVKLLRVLQERTFERVGSVESRQANVRILAATHRDLERRVLEGQFREDLYFRLNVFPIRVPPLRERLEDLQQLIVDLVKKGHAAGRSSLSFSELALHRLREYHWPGNVRELANLVERMSILCGSGRVELEELPPPFADERTVERDGRIAELPSDGLDLRAHLGGIERDLIQRALHQADGTVAQAARLLNLRRTTLVEKLRKYELASWDPPRGSCPDAGASRT
jgi:sigma-54 specific flagellar transcriptional regulator A